MIFFRIVKDEISENWDKQIELDSPVVYVNVDKSKLPLLKNESGQEVLILCYSLMNLTFLF